MTALVEDVHLNSTIQMLNQRVGIVVKLRPLKNDAVMMSDSCPLVSLTVRYDEYSDAVVCVKPDPTTLNQNLGLDDQNTWGSLSSISPVLML